MMKPACIILSGILLTCLLFIQTASATGNTSGTGTVIFTLAGGSFHMMLDGDRFFWLQSSKYQNASERGLYSYNFTDGSKKLIYQLGHQRNVTAPVPTVFESPDGQVISGDRVVYSENGIMLTDITTGSTVQLTNQDDSVLPVSGLRHNQNPWIDGDRVVWTEHDGGYYSSVSGGRIVLLNLTTGERRYVPSGMPGNQSYPRISGDYLIWKDYGDNGDFPDLYLFDIRNGTETRLTAPGALRGVPFIGSGSVFWEEKKSPGINTIVRYTISTGTRSEIGPGCLGQTDALPPVSGDRIVWRVSRDPSDMREERGAIMVMDLRSGETSQITSFRKGLSFPMISGDRIVYTRGDGDDWEREPREVVLYTLPAPRPATMDTTMDTTTTTPSAPAAGDGGLPQSPAPPSPASSGTTPAAPAGLPGLVTIAGVVGAGACFTRLTRRD